MIGPFPPPFHGMSIANKTAYENFKKKHIIKIINTSSKKKVSNLEDSGKFNIPKALKTLLLYIKSIKEILFSKNEIVYITPGQSFLGYVKYIPFIYFSIKKNQKCFLHMHGSYFRQMLSNQSKKRKLMIIKSLKKVSGVIVLGKSQKDLINGYFDSNKVFICNNGVEEYIIASKNEIQEKIKRYVQDDTIRVLYLSNLMKVKGIFLIIRAVERLCLNGIKVQLDIAGAFEPSIKKELQKHFNKFPTVINYHGIVYGQKKKDLLLKNYFFCLPTYHPYSEGQPISILEALVTGNHIITTKNGGILDIVNKNNAEFVKLQDEKSIINALLKNIPKDRLLYNWKYGKENFSAFTFSETLLSIFESIRKDPKYNQIK